MLAAVALIPLSHACLRSLAAGGVVRAFGAVVPSGAVPPPHVAKRSLALLSDGAPALWALPFHIVCSSRNMVVGGCGFKGIPVERAVEVGYAVAPAYRGQGFATAGISALLQLGEATREVDRVIAHIIPSNAASSAVARRLGFVPGPQIEDSDGDQVIRWVRGCVT